MMLPITTIIGLKNFKLLITLLKHLINQLPLFMIAVLHTTFVFNLVSKLILEFFFSNKVFWSKTRDLEHVLLLFSVLKNKKNKEKVKNMFDPFFSSEKYKKYKENRKH